jgi:hypothetical protein
MPHDNAKSPPRLAWRRLASSTPVRRLSLVLAALLVTFVMVKGIVYPWDGLTPYRGDNYEDVGQAVWNLWSTTESVLSLKNPLYTDRVYHPSGAALGKHTLSAGYLPIPLLTKLLTGGSKMYPVYAYNLTTFLAYAAILLFTFLALRAVGFAPSVAVVPALGYAFCDFFYYHFWHLNHLAAFTLPLATWLAVRLWQRPTRGRLLGLVAAVAWSVYLTEFALSIGMAALLFLLASAAVPSLRQGLASRARALGVGNLALAAVAFLIAVAPFAVAYARADALPQPERYFSQWSANAAGLFVPAASSTPLYGGALSGLSQRVTVGLGGFEVFLGYPILLTALLGLCSQRKAIDWIAFGVALIFFVLCLGPTLKIFSTDTGIWLPYAGLKQLPPFDQNRCPVRFVVIGHFFLLFASARGVELVCHRMATRWHATAAALLVSVLAAWSLLECYPPSLREHKPYTPPLAALAKLVPGPVVHTSLPARACNEMLLQVFHGQPIANGCLARPTQGQQAFVQSLRFGMANDWAGYARLLEQAGFKNIIVDRRYPPEAMAALQALPFNVVVLAAASGPPSP